MTTGSRAHVKIGLYDYMLDEASDPHYNHRFGTILSPRTDISGEPGKQQLRPDKLMWTMTDWVGGEGYLTFDSQDPAVYKYSTGLNTRNPGQITGRPDRTDLTTVPGIAEANSDANNRSMLAWGGGLVFFGGGERLSYSSDYGASFTNWTSPGVNAADQITAMTGDHKYIYYASGNSTNVELQRAWLTSGGSSQNQEVVVTRHSTANHNARYVGLAVLNGRVYGWQGRKLYQHDVFETVPLTFNTSYKMVYNSGIQVDYADYGLRTAQGWFGDMKASDNALIMMTSSEGLTNLYQYTKGRGHPLAKLPFGFTGKALTIQNNVAFVVGQFGQQTSGNVGPGGVYAIDLTTRKVFFVGKVRDTEDVYYNLDQAANSFGTQIMFAAGDSGNGKVFIYDMATDGISMLDDLAQTTNGAALSVTFDSSSRIGGLLSAGGHRLVSQYNPGDATRNFNVIAYRDDRLSNRENSGALSQLVESPEHDYDFPMEAKGLTGFYVTYRVEDTGTTSGLLDDQRITIEYSKDGGSYTTAGTIDQATTPSIVQGRAYVVVATGSSSPKFFRLKVRMTLDNNNNSPTVRQLPVVYGVTAEASLASSVEEWEIVVRVKDEPPGSGKGRPSSRRWDGSKIYTYLEDLAQNKAAVTFLDGARSNVDGVYTTHVVTVEDVVFNMQNPGEGTCRLKLKSVVPA